MNACERKILVMKNLCYTIGCKQKSLSEFIDILRNNQINCVIDIRNAQMSKQCDEEYNIENLKKRLNHIGIYYIFMGQEFDLKRGELIHDTANKNESFRKGIDRILSGIRKDYSIVIMSVEKEPFDCIRGVLISRELQKRGIEILHIISSNEIKTQKDSEKEMVKGYGAKLVKMVAELSIRGILDNRDLDMDERDFKQEMINEAYSIRIGEIADSFE